MWKVTKDQKMNDLKVEMALFNELIDAITRNKEGHFSKEEIVWRLNRQKRVVMDFYKKDLQF